MSRVYGIFWLQGLVNIFKAFDLVDAVIVRQSYHSLIRIHDVDDCVLFEIA